MRPHVLGATALLTAAAPAFALGAPAFAQANQAAVERCRALPTDAERFACLEAYLLESDGGAEQPVAPPPADPMPPALAAPSVDEAEAAASAAAAADAAQGRRGFFRLPSIPFVGDGDDSPAAEPEVVDATDSSDADALGFEQVAERSGERQPRVAETRYAFSVVDADESFFGGLQVQLENGQIWRQQRDDGTRILILQSDPIENVEIWQSDRFGGYRMRLVDQGRTIRVERVE